MTLPLIEAEACLVQVAVASDVAFRWSLRGAACVDWGRRRHIVVVSSRRPCQVVRQRSPKSLFCVAESLVVDPIRREGAMHLRTWELGQVVVACRLEVASRKAHGQGLCCCVVQGASRGLLLDR